MPDIRFAVDSNFLMHLARSREEALDALEVIRRRALGAQMLATFTVLDELDHKAQNAPDSETRALARKAMSNITAWGVLPVELNDTQDNMAYSIAAKLLAQGIIPPKERNDALILAEAAVLGCPLLITSDEHLRGADHARLKRVFEACGVPAVVVRKPAEIVRDFGGR